jgi:putative ABC transport system ATP-binding protein
MSLLALDGVHKTYATGRAQVHALRGVDLSIERGELVSVMGPSGAGKTTLLEILGCLSTPSQGRYRLDGNAVESLDDGGLARLRGCEIGFVFQNFNLLPRMTALENVELPLVYQRVPRAERRQRGEESLARVGLATRALHRPSELSGGERQRVAIARALVNHPALLLADEPTGNLDTQTSEEILALLLGLHGEGHTVVLVTHDAAIGLRAPRLVMLRDGCVESDGRPGARG